MDHFFTLHNSKGTQLFLPISSVLKDENASTPTTTSMTGRNIRRSKSENDDDVSPLVLESLRLIPTHENRSSSVQALCSPPGPAAPSYSVPVGGRSALSSSNPAIDSSYGSGRKDNRYRSHSYDSISGPPGHPYNQQYQSTHVAGHAHVDSNPYNLAVGSVILYGNPSRCGVIKWMGYPIGVNSFSAGIEMV